jgi:PAS domain S-box-containing protein
MLKQLRVLIIEDSQDDVLLVIRDLRKGGYEPAYEHVQTAKETISALERNEWDLIISDYVMPRFSGQEALTVLQNTGLDIPFIIVSGNIGEDIAVSAMKAGAHDYLIKGNLARLIPAVERELREAEVRRARRKAEEGRNLLATAIEASADAVVVTTEQGFIQYVNAAFEHITGYTKQEALGQTLHILDSGKHDEPFYLMLRETIKRNGVWFGRLFNRKKDGSLYLEDCTYSPVRDRQGNITNYVSIKRDVTEKVRLESIAESVNMTDNIGYIFSGVRHEIGNPVNSINMTLSILKQKIGTLDQPAVEKYLDRALHEVSRIEYLLRSLKNFNMFEKPILQNVLIRPFMQKFQALTIEDFKAKGIEISVLINENVTSCYVDPRVLQQVLINLLTNAADALEGRQNPKITITILKLDRTVRIRMEDNGCGIPESKMKNLFKPFYTNKVTGTGLGLVIVRKMISQMNGHIEITSRENIGSIADIAVPLGEDTTSAT